eukprot:403377309
MMSSYLEPDYKFYQDCIDVLLLDRKDKVTISGQHKLKDTVIKLFSESTMIFKKLFMNYPIEVSQRTQLMTLPAGQVLNLEEEAMFILLKGNLQIQRIDDQLLESIDKMESRRSFKFGPFLTTENMNLNSSSLRNSSVLSKKNSFNQSTPQNANSSVKKIPEDVTNLRLRSMRNKSFHFKMPVDKQITDYKIIKFSTFTNYELLKQFEQTNGKYLQQLYFQIVQQETDQLEQMSQNPETRILKPGFCINQGSLMPEFSSYNLGYILKAQDQDVYFAKISRQDFENALREKEHNNVDQITDFINQLKPFQNWTRNRVRKLLNFYLKFEKVKKGWQFDSSTSSKQEQPESTQKIYFILDGDFNFQTYDDSEVKPLSKLLDVKKLLFQNKRASLDDRRTYLEVQQHQLQIKEQFFKPQKPKPAFKILQRGHFFGEDAFVKLIILQDQQALGKRKLIKEEKQYEPQYKVTCRSLEGFMLSLQVNDLIKSLLKDDDTFQVMQKYFQVKTNQRDQSEFQDFDNNSQQRSPTPEMSTLSNPMQVFRKQQIDFIQLQNSPQKIEKIVGDEQKLNNGFRSLLLNKREADYRETIKEIIDEYPIIDQQKKIIQYAETMKNVKDSEPIKITKKCLYMNSRIDNQVVELIQKSSLGQIEPIQVSQQVQFKTLKPIYKQLRPIKVQKVESKDLSQFLNSSSNNSKMTVACTLNRSLSPLKSSLIHRKMNQHKSSPLNHSINPDYVNKQNFSTLSTPFNNYRSVQRNFINNSLLSQNQNNFNSVIYHQDSLNQTTTSNFHHQASLDQSSIMNLPKRQIQDFQRNRTVRQNTTNFQNKSMSIDLQAQQSYYNQKSGYSNLVQNQQNNVQRDLKVIFSSTNPSTAQGYEYNLNNNFKLKRVSQDDGIYRNQSHRFAPDKSQMVNNPNLLVNYSQTPQQPQLYQKATNNGNFDNIQSFSQYKNINQPSQRSGMGSVEQQQSIMINNTFSDNIDKQGSNIFQNRR